MDLLATSIESTNDIIVAFQNMQRGFVHIPIRLPRDINTLDFNLSRDTRQAIFDMGFNQATTKLQRLASQVGRAQLLQMFRGPRRRFDPILAAISSEVERATRAQNVRVHLMLPTLDGTRIVAYSYGSDAYLDNELEIPLEAGVTGQAWMVASPAIADLDEVTNPFQKWGMAIESSRLIPTSRRSLAAVPVFDYNRDDWFALHDEESLERKVVATLSIDSTTSLNETGWSCGEGLTVDAKFLTLLSVWADILSRFLAG
jgi:hypothetical protein